MDGEDIELKLEQITYKMNVYVLIALSVILTIALVVVIRYTLEKPEWEKYLLFIGLLLILLLFLVDYYLYRTKNLGKIYGISKGLSVIAIAIIGVYLFEETFNYSALIGIVLIAVGISLL